MSNKNSFQIAARARRSFNWLRLFAAASLTLAVLAFYPFLTLAAPGYLETIFGAVGGAYATNETTNSSGGGGTGILEICTNAAGPGLDDRIFRYKVGAQIYQVPTSACSGPIELPAGPVVVEELLDGNLMNNSGTFSGRFRLMNVTTRLAGGTETPLTSANLTTRQATVNITEGDINNQTVVTFTNTFAVIAYVEICKRAAGAVANGGGSVGPPNPTNSEVTGLFNFTIDALPNQTFTAPVGGCTAPIPVNVPTAPAAVPASATIRVTEIGRAGYTLETASTFPLDRMNSLTTGQGIVNTQACVNAGTQVPSNCLLTNNGGGYIDIDVVEGSVANETIAYFDNRANPARLKICKIAGPGVPEGTAFTFEVRGTAPSSATTIAPGVPVLRAATVLAGPASTGGNCMFVTELDGTTFSKFIVGTPIAIVETGYTGTIPNLGTGQVRTANVRSSSGFTTVSTPVIGNGSFTTSTVPSGTVQLTAASGGNPDLEYGAPAVPGFTGGATVVPSKPETVEVEFAGFVFKPAIFKICKVAGSGVAQGTTFAFITNVVNPPGLNGPLFDNRLTTVPQTLVQAGTDGGFCTIVSPPFPGAFNSGSHIAAAEVNTPTAPLGNTIVTAITSSTGAVASITLPTRQASLFLGGEGSVNELKFTNAAVPTEATPTPTPTPIATPTPSVTPTPTATPTPNPGSAVNVSIPQNLSYSATDNSVIAVPINVGDTTGKGITSYDFKITYDPAIVTPILSATLAGTLSGGFEVNVGRPTPGTLIISGFGSAPLTGSGVLMKLGFNRLGEASTCSSLNFTSFAFNENNPPSATSNGQLCFVGVNVSGAVTYGNSTTPIPGVVMTAGGTPNVAAATTDAAGSYTLSGLGNGNYTVTPSKTGGAGSGITSFDASQISMQLIQTASLSQQQLAAADVSGNGTVTSFDASLIAQTVLGIPNSGTAGTWQFTPVNKTYSGLTENKTGENYSGILLGDVSGNWTAPTPTPSPTATPAAKPESFMSDESAAEQIAADGIPVNLPVRNAAPNADFSIPVLVGDLTGRNVSSFDFEVLYDPAVIEPLTQSVEKTDTLSGAFTVGTNVVAPGRLRVSGYGATRLADSGTLINLKFRAVGTVGTTTALTWNGFLFNEGDPAVNRANGRVSVSDQAAAGKAPFDFDGDGKSDVSIFRPSAGEWWYMRSSDGGNRAFQFGNGTDKLVPADYTGDGKTDFAVWRPSTGEWFVLRSEDNSYYAFPFGTNGDIPSPADFDGDGRADAAVFRPSTRTWYISRSLGGTTIQQFGLSGDIPVVADYDGDNKADIAIYRPSKGEWWLQRSSAGTIAFQFGASTDKPVQGDYTGDGKADVAFFKPSTNEWFVLRSEDSSYYSFPFGASGDIPSPGDYDGDGKFDATIFRPSNNTWFVQRTSSATLILSFGAAGDAPVPSAYIP